MSDIKFRKENRIMPLYTEHSEGEISIYESSFFWFGPPKIGKSTLASGFDRCYFLATSRKEVSKLKVEFSVIDTWDKTLDETNDLIKNYRKYKNKYKFLVIDYVDQAFINCIQHVCKRLKIQHASEAGFGKGVDMIDSEFKKWINQLIASPYGIIFISHIQTKEVMKPGGSVIKTICTLPDRARKIILPLVSVIGCIDFESVKYKDDDGKVKFKQCRVIDFEPSEFLEAGDRDGYLPSKITLPNDPKACFELFKSYYDGTYKKKKTLE